jgi:hypothetical protein
MIKNLYLERKKYIKFQEIPGIKMHVFIYIYIRTSCNSVYS